MKNIYFILFASFFLLPVSAQDLVITGVVDGDLSGGLPKAIEIYVINDIADISEYKISMVYNDNTTSTDVFSFPTGNVSAGDFISITSNADAFNTFFGYSADHVSGSISGNGDDRYLIMKDAGIIDIFGEFSVDGTGTVWEYSDGFAYRKSGTDPGTTFNGDDWDIYKLGLEDCATNSAASVPFPSKSYTASAAADTDPPAWADGFPYLIPYYDTGGNLYLKADEACTVYYVVLPDGSETPTSEEVKAGVDFGTSTVLKAEALSLEADISKQHFIDGADPDTSYDIYVVAEDGNSNLQASPVRFDITTGAARTITVSNPIAKETYFVGDQVTFEWTASSNILQVEIVGYHYRNEELFVIAADEQGYPLYIDASIGTYDYTIPLDAASDSVAIIIRNAQDYSVCDTVTPVYLDDIIPPGIVEIYPSNQSVDQGTTVQITLEYNEEIFPGTGKFYLRNEDGSLFEEMDISGEGDAQPLDIVMDGYQININPTSDYLVGNTYYLEADEGVLLDYFDNPTDAISGSSTLSFTIIKGSDASLADLMVSGTSIDGFDPGTYVYTYTVAAGETVVPTLSAEATDPNADISIDPAINLDGTPEERTATVTVVADDQSATLNYTVTFELATGIEDELAREIRIYPVPVSTELILENISSVDYIEVLDITGSRVYEEVTGGVANHRINVSSLPRGIYFLKLSEKKGITTRKFIKR